MKTKAGVSCSWYFSSHSLMSVKRQPGHR